MPSFFSIRFCFVVFFFVFCLDYLALQALTCSVKTSRFETVLPNFYFDKMNLDFSKFFLDFRKLKLCFANTQTSIQKFRTNPRDTRKHLCDFATLREKNQPLREIILSVYESFYIFVAEFRNELKKGGNGKQKDYYNDLVF